MNAPQSPEIHNVFLNVRKAYRLLHDYQQMVLDAVRYIEGQLDVSVPQGWPKFTNPPSNFKLSHSSWNWLQMVCYQFQLNKVLDGRAYSLFLLVISDTGFFESDEGVGREDTDKYAEAANSSTKFAFILCRTGTDGWNSLEFLNDKKAVREFIQPEGHLPQGSGADGLFGKCYEMSCLASEAETDKVVRDIVELAKASDDFPINYRNAAQ